MSVLLRDPQPTQRIGIVARFTAAMPFFYVGLDLPGVECAVEGPELDGSRRPLKGEGRV